jgi:hypothetical protein
VKLLRAVRDARAREAATLRAERMRPAA